MKKQLFLSLALLTIGSALHAGKGAAFGGGFATGMLTGAVINNASRPREREVVYVKGEQEGQSKKHLHKRLKEQEKRIKRLEKQLAKKNGAASAA